MHHIVYQSRANQSLTDTELLALLQHARQANEQHHITGALVYGGGQFIQIVEGERGAVAALYDRIRSDTRHSSVLKLADKPISQRSFAEWSMAFSMASPAWLTRLAGSSTLEQLEQQLPIASPVDTLLLNMIRELILASPT